MARNKKKKGKVAKEIQKEEVVDEPQHIEQNEAESGGDESGSELPENFVLLEDVFKVSIACLCQMCLVCDFEYCSDLRRKLLFVKALFLLFDVIVCLIV